MNQTRELVTQKTTRIFYNIFHTFVTAKPAEQMFVSKLGFKFLKASKKAEHHDFEFPGRNPGHSQAKFRVVFTRKSY